MKALLLFIVAAILMLISLLFTFKTKKIIAYYVDYFERSQYKPKYMAKYHASLRELAVKVLRSNVTLLSCRVSGIALFVMTIILLYVSFLS